MILPEAVYFGSTVTIFVAEDVDQNVMLGTIAVSMQPRIDPVRGLRLAMHVVAPFRNLGIEEQLLTAAEAVVRARGAEARYTWGAIEAGSEIEHFWRRMGFDHAEQIIEGRTDLKAGLAFLEPIWQQLCQRGKVPANLLAVTLDQADPHEIVRLYTETIGGSYRDILRVLTGESASHGFDPYISPVLRSAKPPSP